MLLATACGGSPGAPQPTASGGAGAGPITQGGESSSAGAPGTDLPPIVGGAPGSGSAGAPASGGAEAGGSTQTAGGASGSTGGTEPACINGGAQQCACSSGINGIQVCESGAWGSCMRCAAGKLTVSWDLSGLPCPGAATVTVVVVSADIPANQATQVLSFVFDKPLDCSSQTVSLPAIAAPQAVSIQVYLGPGVGYVGPITAQIADSETTDVTVTFPPPPYPVVGSGMASVPH